MNILLFLLPITTQKNNWSPKKGDIPIKMKISINKQMCVLVKLKKNMKYRLDIIENNMEFEKCKTIHRPLFYSDTHRRWHICTNISFSICFRCLTHSIIFWSLSHTFLYFTLFCMKWNEAYTLLFSQLSLHFGTMLLLYLHLHLHLNKRAKGTRALLCVCVCF